MVRVGAPGSSMSGAGPIDGGANHAATGERPLYGLSHVMEVEENLRMVSNLAAAGSEQDSRAARRSQAFTTGPDPLGYVLGRVEMQMRGSGSSFTGSAELHTTDAQGRPDALHATLSTGLSHSRDNHWALTAPPDTALAASTTYAVVFGTMPGVNPGDPVQVQPLDIVTGDSEDNPEPGWTIADAYHYDDSGTWTEDGDSNAVELAVLAARKPTTTFVKNLAQSSDDSVGSSGRIAQAFTTGSHTAGYRLSGIDVDSQDSAGDSFTAAVYTADASGHPDTLVANLTAPGSFAAGVLAFTAPTGTTLTAGTTYAVVFDPGSNNLTYDATPSDAEDSGASTGWSIADTHVFRAGASWSNSATGVSIRIAVKGETVPVTNVAPVFSPDMVTRSVAENTGAGFDVGAPVTATDTDTLTYSLGGTDAASFVIIPATGQIRTKSGVTYDYESRTSYTVTVTASDNIDTADATVTINVTDVAEPPAAPAAPTVRPVSGSSTSLAVSWTAPANEGKPAIDTYDLQYRAGTSGPWTAGPSGVTGTGSTLSSLAAGALHQVQVRAVNAEGSSAWSTEGEGTTSATGTVTLVKNLSQGNDTDIAANTRVAQVFTTGSATGGYTLSSIDIDSEDAQGDSFTAALYTTDSSDDPDALVANLGAPGSFAAGVLAFTAPANTALTADTTYAVVIDPGSNSVSLDATLSDGEDAGADTGWSIANTHHFGSGWQESSSGASIRIAVGGRPASASNVAPVFSPATVRRSVAENSPGGRNVGAPVRATDTDALTYTLGGTDAASFDIVSTSGQIRTSSGQTYDHEAKASYTVTVTASDNIDTAVANVTINVTDVAEPPAAPAAPTVNGVVGSGTTLAVSWTAPANDGKPPIRTYALQSRAGTTGPWTAGPGGVTGTGATLTGLTAETLYEVQVMAMNDEGSSAWSAAGEGTTNAAGPATFISNVGQGNDDSAGSSSGGTAQAFVTGTIATGYVLTGIDVVSEDAEGDAFSVAVHTADASGHPDTLVANLTSPGDFAAGTLAFTAPPNTTLEAGTTYVVVATIADAANPVTYDSTASNDEDGNGAPEWSIADAFIWNGGTNWTTTSSGESLRIAVKGTVKQNVVVVPQPPGREAAPAAVRRRRRRRKSRSPSRSLDLPGRRSRTSRWMRPARTACAGP